MSTIETFEKEGLRLKIEYDENGRDFDEDFKHPEPFHTYGKWNNYSLFEFEGYLSDWEEHILREYHHEIIKTYKSLNYSDCLEDYDYYNELGVPDIDKVKEIIKKWSDNNIISLPIYVYEHSGITMNTGGYSCRWDSGEAGVIYMSKREAMNNYESKRWTKKLAEQVEDDMKRRIKYLAAIAEGNIYGFVVEDEEGEILDSCWGFVETEWPIEKTCVYTEGMESLDYWVKKKREANTVTVTVEMTVFTDDEEMAKQQSQTDLEKLLDGSDYTSINVIKAKKDLI